jgi:hypothetical protein
MEGPAVSPGSRTLAARRPNYLANRKERTLISLITHIFYSFFRTLELLNGPLFLAPADTREENRASTIPLGSGSTP